MIAIDDLYRIRGISGINIHPALPLAIYTLTRPDPNSDTNIRTLYLVDLDTGTTAAPALPITWDRVFLGNASLYFFQYRKDSTRGYTRCYGMGLAGGGLAHLWDLPYEVKALLEIGRQFYFTAALKPGHPEKPCHYTGVGIPESLHLFRLDPGSKKDHPQCTMVSPPDRDIHCLDLMPGTGTILYTGSKMCGPRPLCQDLFTLDPATGRSTPWTQNDYRIKGAAGLSATDIAFAAVRPCTQTRNDNETIFSLDTTTGKISPIRPGDDTSLESMGIATDHHAKDCCRMKAHNKRFYFVTPDRFKETLRSVDINGNEKIHETGLTTIDSFAVSDAGILAAGLSPGRLQEVYLCGTGSKRLTRHNRWLKNKPYTPPVPLENGPVDGWVIAPANLEQNRTYPGILMIHGGPKGMFGNVYAHDAQVLSARGYYVFYCNPRGSDGRGREFADIRGHFAQKAYEDLMAFTDAVIEQYPRLDPSRLGVTGGSFGGYMTNYIITRTQRFRAAVSERGICALDTCFVSSDIGFEYVFEYMGNCHTPWTAPELYRDASPIHRAHKVATPTLFTHGRADLRCHFTESRNMHAALAYHGVPTELLLLDGQCHDFTRTGTPSARRARYRAMTDWFNKYLT